MKNNKTFVRIVCLLIAGLMIVALFSTIVFSLVYGG